jgi:peptide/nickel transport system substrate-binding protein
MVQHLGGEPRWRFQRPAATWLDTLWYIDADAGIDGVWDNSLASDKPTYNADFTEMTVKLRDGIFWSDGVEFTADDVVYTVETQMKNPSMLWGPAFLASLDTVTAPDKKTVVFKLKRPSGPALRKTATSG